MDHERLQELALHFVERCTTPVRERLDKLSLSLKYEHNRAEALLAELRRFGTHLPSCDLVLDPTKPCSCGFTRALRGSPLQSLAAAHDGDAMKDVADTAIGECRRLIAEKLGLSAPMFDDLITQVVEECSALRSQNAELKAEISRLGRNQGISQVMLVDCDNVSHRHFSASTFSGWEQCHIELFGRKDALDPWLAACRDKFPDARIDIGVRLTNPPVPDAANSELCMRLGQFLTMDHGLRPQRVMILGRDHIYRQPVIHLVEQGIDAWIAAPVYGIEMGNKDAGHIALAYREGLQQTSSLDGWVPLTTIGNVLKGYGFKVTGKLSSQVKKAGFIVKTDSENTLIRPSDLPSGRSGR
jgi:hypothetical protein